MAWEAGRSAGGRRPEPSLLWDARPCPTVLPPPLGTGPRWEEVTVEPRAEKKGWGGRYG